MIPEEYAPMIRKLIPMTKNKKIEWEPTSDMNKFELEADNNTIIINQYNDYETGQPSVSFEIRDNYGNLIDGMYISSGEGDYEELERLFSEARRNALKIENTISNIMSFLNSKD